MAANQINVLHLDSSRSWRGGQQQAAYLVQAMAQQRFHTAVACPADSPFADFCVEHAIPYFPLAIRSEFDFPAAYRIARICKEKHYQIIHAHDAHSLSIATLAKLFYPQLVVIAARRVDFHVRKPLIGAWKYSNPWVSHIITVSEKIRDILIEDGVPQHKITTVHSGIDIHKFKNVQGDAVRHEFSIPSNHFLVGTVAAIAGHKDYPTLLQAAKIACDRDKKLTFLAVGSGPDEAAAKKMANELGLDRFVFAGFRSDVGRFLKSFDAFVLSSKTEGLGTSLLDAQAVGLPIVATRAGGIPEIVKDNRNGFLVPVQHPQALAEKILQLKNKKETRQRFSANALLGVRDFDISNTVRKTIEVYQLSCTSS